jgi:murein L,D-transpeptidase YafK
MTRLRALAASLLVAGTLAGCAPGLGELPWWQRSRFQDQPAAVLDGPAIDPDSQELPWARNEEYFIVIRRSCRTLDLFQWGRLVKSYPVVFGMNPMGPKLYQGDLRTPTGFYMIVEKRVHPRWARFLLLDYPNNHDVQRYSIAMAEGKLPRHENGYPDIGGAIGIHGSDKEEMNARNVDWTFGCISLTNRDVLELSSLAPVGTPVLIEE